MTARGVLVLRCCVGYAYLHLPGESDGGEEVVVRGRELGQALLRGGVEAGQGLVHQHHVALAAGTEGGCGGEGENSATVSHTQWEGTGHDRLSHLHPSSFSSFSYPLVSNLPDTA